MKWISVFIIGICMASVGSAADFVISNQSAQAIMMLWYSTQTTNTIPESGGRINYDALPWGVASHDNGVTSEVTWTGKAADKPSATTIDRIRLRAAQTNLVAEIKRQRADRILRSDAGIKAYNTRNPGKEITREHLIAEMDD